MSRKEYKKYFEVLELTPLASYLEIKNKYRFLKKLYSADSAKLSPIADEFSQEKRNEILKQIEEAYLKLMTMMENEYSQSIFYEDMLLSEDDRADEKTEDLSFSEEISRHIRIIFKAKALSKSYNNRLVVKGADLEVVSGEIVGLLGRNGAGKTTTFQMMVGLVKPNNGSIYLDERNISSLSTHQRAEKGITYLPQENSVFLKTTVEKNLLLVLQLQRIRKKKQRKIARQLLDELGLHPLANQSAHSLSGGERRKLEICRSLILDPKFLLFDEPFTGIDPLTTIDLQKILVKLRNRGIGIIISDHNIRDTLRIADRAYVIDEGEILVEGKPQEIASDEKAKERFLGKNFKLGDEVEAYSF